MKLNSTCSCIRNKKTHSLTPSGPMVTDNSKEVKDGHLGGAICQSLKIKIDL